MRIKLMFLILEARSIVRPFFNKRNKEEQVLVREDNELSHRPVKFEMLKEISEDKFRGQNSGQDDSSGSFFENLSSPTPHKSSN